MLKEGMALFYMLKQFRICLLWANPFQVVTDQQARSGVFKKKDVHGPLAHWLDLFAKHDFDILYQLGAANAAVDYLLEYVERNRIECRKTF